MAADSGTPNERFIASPQDVDEIWNVVRQKHPLLLSRLCGQADAPPHADKECVKQPESENRLFHRRSSFDRAGGDENRTSPTAEVKRKCLLRLLDDASHGYRRNCDARFQTALAMLCAMAGKPKWKEYVLAMLKAGPIGATEAEKSAEESKETGSDGCATGEQNRGFAAEDLNDDNDDGDCDADALYQRANGFLHDVAKAGQCRHFKEYLNADIVSVRNNLGETPLHLATEFEHCDDARVLLEVGAKLESDKWNCTPLHSAAMAGVPDPDIVRELVKAAEKSKEVSTEALLDQTSTGGNNTALHIAVGNANVTKELIAEFASADPKKRNDHGDTPFHVAAKSANQNAILYMLHVFAPSNSNWDIDDVENDEKRADKAERYVFQERCKSLRYEGTHPKLLDICAAAGNAEAVAFLIQHGADISKGVLHEIVVESVKTADPERVRQLVAVYRAVVDNTVTWKCLDRNRKAPPRGSDEYRRCQRSTMIGLLTTASSPSRTGDVLECAIRFGAVDMLHEIINTVGVFREDVNERAAFFDVTNFTKSTTAEDELDRCACCPCGRRSRHRKTPYLRTLLRNQDTWLDKSILNEQPLRDLCAPYFCIIQRFYFCLGAIQLVYMILLSTFHLPTTCFLSYMFSIGVADCDASAFQVSDVSRSAGYDVWPAILCVGSLPILVYELWSIAYSHCEKRFSSAQNGGGVSPSEHWLPKTLVFLLQMCPVVGFYVSEFIWASLYSTSESYGEYLQVTSMVFLFGWLATLSFFSGVSKQFCVFSLLLTEIVVKDIVFSFLLVFAFAVVAFSYALHVLRLVLLPDDDHVELKTTVHDLFGAAFGIGDFMESTRDNLAQSNIQFPILEVVFMAYICLAVLILLNVLIAMMNNRYEIAKRRAENFWRFQILRTALELERFKWFRRRIRGLLQNSYDATKCHAYWCGFLFCYCRTNRLKSLRHKRAETGHRFCYVLKVKFAIGSSRDK